ncbi:MAG: hypothetical protein JKX94_08595 [Sneathiella sp.]|nr:hypothetical protein [Sneathiella sp.]
MKLAEEKGPLGLTLLLAVMLLILVVPDLKDREKSSPNKLDKPPLQELKKPFLMKAVTLPPPPARSSVVALKSVERPVKSQAPDRLEPTEKPKTPVSQNAVKQTVTVDKPTADMVAEGRVLLKLLETGKGPNVEIAWPQENRHRERLFDAFVTCLGLQSGLMDNNGQIFLETGLAGQSAKINSDQTSLFLRQSAGQIPSSEQRILENIKRRHHLSNAQPVRLFDRIVDAALLGALFRLIPQNGSAAAQIRATYSLGRNAVVIHDIWMKDQKILGQIKVQLGLLGKCR